MADAHSAEELRKHVRIYMAVFGSLAVLTVVTVWVGYLHLSVAPALMVALAIACVKGGLVAAYFMHLKGEKRMIYWVLYLSAAFFLDMVILFVWAYYDQAGTYIVS